MALLPTPLTVPRSHRQAEAEVPTQPPAAETGSEPALSQGCSPFQWRKCRIEVNTIAMPRSSAAAMTSASRTLPPG